MAVVVGIPLSAWLVFACAPKAGRPWALRGIAFLAVFWAFLFVAFNLGPGDNLEPLLPLSKAVIAVPQAIVAATLIVLVVISWRDLCDRRLWTSTEDP